MAEASLTELYAAREAQVREVVARVLPEAEVEAAVGEARGAFAKLAPELPYADRRDHIMFEPSFAVFQWLAVYQAVRERGVDAHALGRSILALPANPSPAGDLTPEAIQRILAEAQESQREAAPHEFVFELVPGGEHEDWGMNVTACAVCHAYARHDAMELVPYMCASDDRDSAAGDLGLRRTGTIALGAHRCDFRYERGGEPLPLADQYPDRIKLEP
jgi:hypothetical protein